MRLDYSVSRPDKCGWPIFTQTCSLSQCTLVQALRFCAGHTANRGSRGIARIFHYHGTRRGWGVCVTPRPLFTPGKDPLLIVHEAGWNPGPVWTGAENLAPTGIRSPDRPGRSQSVYLLRYSAHLSFSVLQLIPGQNIVVYSIHSIYMVWLKSCDRHWGVI